MGDYNKDFFDFIEINKKQDPNNLRLSLKKSKINFDLDFAIVQIEARKKYAKKLRDFLSNSYFLFPSILSGEQSSNQAVASYHSNLVEGNKKILDLTAGLGIDAMSFAKTGSNVTAVEIDQLKADILKWNCNLFDLGNLSVINKDALEILNSERERSDYDVIFIDPSRRDSKQKRVFNLHDCSPDVITLQKTLLSVAPKILIKASPLLDLTQTVKDFPSISSIRVVGVKGECKEILVELDRNKSNEIITEAIELDNNGNILNSFLLDSSLEKNASLPILNPEQIKSGGYILEPSAMVMKLAPWRTLAHQFNAKKFSPSSHLFFTEILPKDFPGRVTKIEKVLKKQDRKALAGFPASVVSRNYPLTSEDLRKNLKLREGDENFIYASRVGSVPFLILTTQNL